MKLQITQRRFARTAAGIAVAAVAFVGGTSLAGPEERPIPDPAPAGVPSDGAQTSRGESASRAEAITTGSATYDSTTLTKFIPAWAFVPTQGEGTYNDTLRTDGTSSATCVSPGTGLGGQTIIDFFAPVELPDGAQITGVTFTGIDSAAQNITISLLREQVNESFVLFGSPSTVTRSTPTIVTSFSTSGTPGVTQISNPATPALAEDVGYGVNGGGFVLTGFYTRFHTLKVSMVPAAGLNNAICGVEVNYKVPVPANPGVVFFPITPFRAFDSRDADYGPAATILAPGGVKTISIADGHDLTTGVTNATNLVPAGATAITYNITITGATGGNFVAVTPGDATTFGVSTINFNGVMDVANGATVGIDASRQIKLFGGAGSGSVHVIVDVTGYYAAYSPPNMGN